MATASVTVPSMQAGRAIGMNEAVWIARTASRSLPMLRDGGGRGTRRGLPARLGLGHRVRRDGRGRPRRLRARVGRLGGLVRADVAAAARRARDPPLSGGRTVRAG